MPKPGPRTTYRYSAEFKATAVHLSQLPGVSVSEVAESLYIHPFMLSRWRRLAREGQIMTKRGGDVTAAARPARRPGAAPPRSARSPARRRPTDRQRGAQHRVRRADHCLRSAE